MVSWRDRVPDEPKLVQLEPERAATCFSDLFTFFWPEGLKASEGPGLKI